MNPWHWLRMAKWARRPPSKSRVKLVFVVLVLCLSIAAVERFIGWPEALTLEKPPRFNLKP
ncbi:hypothetical protein KO498_10790 [Lentibacter algarum]|uniref:hypothetical protein n=1 Tax=Lentibacter algarum TaxID=576131 RepID=UPI001C07CD21|nr:hypothetical protein [Lentibacter algarum]MBU2982293.1 hypothetical protein [Lentibacter algarum]